MKLTLNTKNVYKADGYVVKVTSLLYIARKTTEMALGDPIEEDNATFKFHVTGNCYNASKPFYDRSVSIRSHSTLVLGF